MIAPLLAIVLAAAGPDPGHPDPQGVDTAARAEHAEPPPREDPDAQLLKDLELLQQLELLDHLDLFDEGR